MTHRTSDYVLGVMRGPDALYAVLVEQTEDGPVVQVSFPPTLIPRSENGEDFPGTDDALGGRTGGADFTIQFEEAEEEITQGEEVLGGSGGFNTEPPPSSRGFLSVLEGIRQRCAEQGYEDPDIAFCAPYSEIEQVELHVPSTVSLSPTTESEETFSPDTLTALLEVLEDQYAGEVDAGRVGFLPMSKGKEGEDRVLALISHPRGSVPATIAALPDPGLLGSSPATLLETEASIYFAWARSVLGPSLQPEEKSLVVRVGTEDTLLLFMEGAGVQQVDTLPSLTVEDPADTICSRVLLYQDEYGMGDVQHILLVGEDQGSELVEGFEPYFSKTNIHRLWNQLPYRSEYSDSGLYEAAIGAAVRVLDPPGTPFDSPPLNLMGSEKQRAFGVPAIAGWEAPVLLVILVVSGLGLGWYGVHNDREIRQKRAELRSLEQQVERTDRAALKTKVDSLQAIVDRGSRGQGVIEDLLRGSNKWSRGLARVAAHVSAVGGLSVREWQPRSVTEVQVNGYATTRPRIVELARGLDAEIAGITFTDIRDRSLYGFSLTVPLDTSTPKAVSYWRTEQETLAASDSTPGHGTDSREGVDSGPAGQKGDVEGGVGLPQSTDASVFLHTKTPRPQSP